MYRMGVLDQDGGLWSELTRRLPKAAGQPVRWTRQIGSESARLDGLILAPSPGRLPAVFPACRVLLIPGQLGCLAVQIPCVWAVSYGFSRRDTLTVSSLTDHGLEAALQREILTITGATIERQELMLPAGPDPLTLLALTGAALLLGKSPC